MIMHTLRDAFLQRLNAFKKDKPFYLNLSVIMKIGEVFIFKRKENRKQK